MKSDQVAQVEILPPPVLFDGKDEMNFAEVAPTLLTDRAPAGTTSLKRTLQLYDPKRKRHIIGTQLIEGSKEHGLPTAGDSQVHLALIQLTKLKNNFTSPEVEFTRQELLDLLGWSDQGKNYERLKLALLRLKHVVYEYDNAWWDNRQKTWTTRAFNIIDNLEINDSRNSDGQGQLFLSRIKWNEIVFKSFNAGYLRTIDYELCKQFAHPIALQMYRFLGKRAHHSPDMVFPLKDFAFGHLGLIGNYEGKAQIARSLSASIKELERIGFLAPLPDSQRYFRKDGIWHIRLVVITVPKAGVPPIQAILEAPAKPGREEPDPLARDLVALGITAKKAAAFVRQRPADYLRAKIDLVSWMQETDPDGLANPAGFLVRAIEDDYKPPKEYVPRAKREEDARKAEAARQTKAEAAKQEARQKAEERATRDREREEAQAIEEYWQSLSPTEQEEHAGKAEAAADEESLNTYRRMPVKTRPMWFRVFIRNPYVRGLLQQAEAAE